MTKFVLVPDSFSGNLSFIFDHKGYLVEFSLNSWDVAQELHAGVLRSLAHCLTDAQFVEWAKRLKYKFTREEIDLSWLRFYEMYGVKRDGYRAEPLWNKLSEKEKYFTLINLKAYNRWCKRNPAYTKKYPAAYLAAHRKDDWDKVPDWNKTTPNP